MGQTESNFADDDALIMEDDLDANLDNVYVAKQPEASSSAFSDLATANDEALENIFKEIDVDDSKSIDLSEFKAFIMKKRPSYYGSQSELVNPNFDANEALDEAKKNGSDPDTIAKLQRDVHKQQSKERFEVGKQEKSKVALAAEKALDEAKKNGSDPDTIAKLQRDVHKQQSKERFEVGKQEKSKVALAAEKALDEAKKNGSDPDTIAKLQRDVHKQQSKERFEVGKQEKSKVALAAEKALDEAKKNGSDPDTIAKLQRDVHKQQSKERFEVGKQEKSKAAYAPKATIPSQENVSERNYEATGVMANILKKKALKAEKIKLHASASIIQKHARAYIARNLFSVLLTKKRREASACKIQNFVRSFLWFRFLKIMVRKKIHEENASILQRWIRRLLWLQFFKKFWFKKAIEKEQNDAARILQGFGKVLRAKEILRLKRLHVKCALKIQRVVRRFFWFKFLKRMLLKLAEERQQNDAAIVIQIFWRMAAAKMILEEKLFEKKIMDAVIALQGFRKVILAKGRKKALMEIKVKHDSASIIQRLVRRYFWLRFFKRFWLKKAREREVQNAAEVIQGFSKIISAKRTLTGLRRDMHRHKSAIRIETRIRVMLARCKFIPMLIYHRREVAAVFCQKTIRQHLAKKKFRAIKEAHRLYVGASRIQRCWKRKQDYTRFRLFLQLRRTTNATIVLQTWVRQRQQMLNYFKILWAAKKIQWMFREYKWNQLRLLKSEYILIKSRAISRWHHTAKTTVFDCVRQSATRIQRTYRGLLGRRKFRRLKEEFCIQEQLRIAKIREMSIEKVYISSKDHQNYRKMLLQRAVGEDRFREHVDYFLFSECVLIIQSAYRRHIMRKWFRKYCLYYSKYMNEIITFQANVRRHFTRQRYLEERHNTLKYIVNIQRTFRIYRFVCSLSRRRLARLKLQTHARRFIAKARYSRKKAAVAVLWRLFKRNLVKFWIRKLKRAVRSLQCHVRAHAARCIYVKIRSNTIKIQSFVRMLYAQTRISKMRAASVLVQRHYRGHTCKLSYVLTKNLVCRLQQIFRNFRLRQSVRKIQRVVRRKIIFKDRLGELLRFAYFYTHVDKVILVQSTYRGKRVRRKYNIVIAEKKAYKACYECLRPKLFAEIKSKSNELKHLFTLKRKHRDITLPVLLLEIEHYHGLKAEQLKEASAGALLVEQYRQKCAFRIQRSFRLYLSRRLDERDLRVSRRTTKHVTQSQAVQTIQFAWRRYRLKCREAQEAKNFLEAIRSQKSANERKRKLKSNRLHILNRIFRGGSGQVGDLRSSFI